MCFGKPKNPAARSLAAALVKTEEVLGSRETATAFGVVVEVNNSKYPYTPSGEPKPGKPHARATTDTYGHILYFTDAEGNAFSGPPCEVGLNKYTGGALNIAVRGAKGAAPATVTLRVGDGVTIQHKVINKKDPVTLPLYAKGTRVLAFVIAKYETYNEDRPRRTKNAAGDWVDMTDEHGNVVYNRKGDIRQWNGNFKVTYAVQEIKVLHEAPPMAQMIAQKNAVLTAPPLTRHYGLNKDGTGALKVYEEFPTGLGLLESRDADGQLQRVSYWMDAHVVDGTLVVEYQNTDGSPPDIVKHMPVVLLRVHAERAAGGEVVITRVVYVTHDKMFWPLAISAELWKVFGKELIRGMNGILKMGHPAVRYERAADKAAAEASTVPLDLDPHGLSDEQREFLMAGAADEYETIGIPCNMYTTLNLAAMVVSIGNKVPPAFVDELENGVSYHQVDAIPGEQVVIVVNSVALAKRAHAPKLWEFYVVFPDDTRAEGDELTTLLEARDGDYSDLLLFVVRRDQLATVDVGSKRGVSQPPPTSDETGERAAKRSRRK